VPAHFIMILGTRNTDRTRGRAAWNREDHATLQIGNIIIPFSSRTRLVPLTLSELYHSGKDVLRNEVAIGVLYSPLSICAMFLTNMELRPCHSSSG
jgi:hypothetical protein